MESENKSNKKIGVFFSIVVGLAVVFVTVFSENKSQTVLTSGQISQTPAQNPVVPAPTTSQTPPADTGKRSVYKDGTYSATGSYNSPGGPDQLGVTVTISNDVIADVSVTSGAGDRTSQRYQNMFISSYKQFVVGQDISSLNLGKISGSSLTPIGFNDALAKIKTQAKS